MHCHCGTNNRAPRWTFTDPCKPEVRSQILTRFDVFLDLVILVYFNAISIDFYEVKSFICIIFV